ncbi:MAG: hypothetical protein ABI321_00755, partial [Polyangia bacterium]
MRSSALVLVVTLAGACSEPTFVAPLQGLPVVHAYDADAAARGWNLLSVDTVGEPAIPRIAIESLSVVWPGGENYPGTYWSAFRERYGLHEAPFDNDGLPLGIRPVGNYVTFDCMLCHAGTVAGTAMLGVANSTLDVQGLLDDLTAAAKLAGIASPVNLTHRTGAAGATDAVGMAFALGGSIYGVPDGTLNDEIGFERAPAWWQLKYKMLTFNDGSGDAPSFRTMAGTLLAFGLSVDQIAARSADFEDIGNWILSLPDPKWPFEALREKPWKRGQVVFDRTCSTCHGTYHDGASYPNVVVPYGEVGTDPVRTLKFRKQEADAINSTWFGTPPMRSTDGYLAPTLVGIWARAPYLHNGSVPDLQSLLDSAARPPVWQR